MSNKIGKDLYKAYFKEKLCNDVRYIERNRVFLRNLVLISYVAAIASAILFFPEGIGLSIFSFLVIAWPVPLLLKKFYDSESRAILLSKLLAFWGEFNYYPKRDGLCLYIYKCLRRGTSIVDDINQYFSYRLPVEYRFEFLKKIIDFSEVKIGESLKGKFGDLAIEILSVKTYLKFFNNKKKSKVKKTFDGIVMSIDMPFVFDGISIVSGEKMLEDRLNNPEYMQNILDIEEVLNASRKQAVLNKQDEEMTKAIEINEEDLIEKLEAVFDEEDQEQAKDDIDEESTSDVEFVSFNIQNSNFQKYYKIYSNNQEEALKLLKADVLEAFYSFSAFFKHKTNLVFADNKLYLIIRTTSRRWFRLPFFRSVKNINRYKYLLVGVSGLLSLASKFQIPNEE